MRGIAIVGAAAACIVWLCFIPWNRVLTGQNDYLGQFCGAELAGTPLLHDAAACQQVQMKAAGASMAAVVFIRPDYYAVLLKPLALVSYRYSLLIFTLLNGAALALAIYLIRDRKDVLILAAVSIPVISSFLNGQDLPLVLAALLAAIALDRMGKGFLGGLCLAMCAIKPHLFIFVPIALIAGRRWRLTLGASVGVSTLFFIAALSQGWDWFPNYLRFLRAPDFHPMPFPMPNLRGLASALPSGQMAVEIGGSVIVLGWLLYAAYRSTPDQFEHLVAMAIAAGLLVSHHLGVHDCTMLLAVAGLATIKSRPYKVAMMLAAPVSYWVVLLASPISIIPALALAGGFFSDRTHEAPR